MKFVAVAVLALLAQAQDKLEYSIKGEAFEGCECESVCPCIWTKDATFAECRGTMTIAIREGRIGKTDVSGVAFAMSLTKTDKNMLKGLGHWQGSLYLPEKASDEQRRAVEQFFRARFGPAFSKVDVKTVPIEVTLEAEHKEVTVGTLATVKISAVRTPQGKVTVIQDPPFALYPKLHVAKADVNTYKDGSTWDFSGHNAFYGPLEFSSNDPH
jgi:hypothetical protein